MTRFHKYDKWKATSWTFLLLATFAVAQSTSNVSSTLTVPRLVKFSSTVKDDSGHAKTGVVGVTFAFYKDQEGGSPLWLEVQNVQADSKGSYTALLGSTKPDGLPADLFTSNEARWLGVQIEGQAEQPRVVFVSVPYALKAADAETIGGLPPSAFVQANPANTTGAGVGETSATSLSTAAAKILPPALLNVITPSPGATSGFVPLWTGTSPTHTLGSSAFFETSSKLIGLNTKTPGASLEIDSQNQLGLFVNAPFTGVGAGVQWNTTGTGGKGWEMLATGKNASQGASKLNIRDLAGGTDVFTIAPGGLVGIDNVAPAAPLDVIGNNSFTAARIVNESTGTALEAVSANGNAIFGRSQFGLYGVGGDQDLATGAGVYGELAGVSSIFTKFSGSTGAGVWGDTGGTGGAQLGVVGTADNAIGVAAHTNGAGSPALYAVNDTTTAGSLIFDAFGGSVGGECSIDVSGNLLCSGTLTGAVAVQGGARKVALYAVESAENWFEDAGSGELVNGAATVRLDATFAQTVSSAGDYHIFLTPEGDCHGLYVSNKTANGFDVHELGGGASSVAFDYRIMAKRKGYESVRLEDVTSRPVTPSFPEKNSAPLSGPLPMRPQPTVSTAPPELTNSGRSPDILAATTAK